MKIVLQKTFLDFKIPDEKKIHCTCKYSSTDFDDIVSLLHITYLHVVFPTPPFPPTKIQRNVFWSMIFWIVASRGSNSSLVSAAAILNLSKLSRGTREWDLVVQPLDRKLRAQKLFSKMADETYNTDIDSPCEVKREKKRSRIVIRAI